jgi:amidohydrolase
VSAPVPGLAAELLARLETELPDAGKLRRRLHLQPRLSGDEADTVDLLLAELGGLPAVKTSGGAVVRAGATTGPAVGLRVELDALPLTEDTAVDWRSRNQAMHACGHDVHMAAAVAVARSVRAVPAAPPLVLTLQPREESAPSGAIDMISSDALAAQDVRAFVGVHVQPAVRRGEAGAMPGPINAACDDAHITVHGKPGHGAYPHITADPVTAAADLIGILQHLVSRQVDPLHPTVLTIGSISGGQAPNVVPAEVRMSGTLRTFDEADRQRLRAAVESAASAVTSVHGCRATVRWDYGEPVLRNHDGLARATQGWLTWAGIPPSADFRSCGADDFAYYCCRYPAMMIFVGVGDGDPRQPGLHHPGFLPTEDDLAAVARAMLAGYLGAWESQLPGGTGGRPTA